MLALGLALLASFAVWYVVKPSPDQSQGTTFTPSASPVGISRQETDQLPAKISATSSPRPKSAFLSPPEIPVAPAPWRSSEVVSVPALEQRIRGTRSVEDRADLITELAHVDSAEALLALERLFAVERHPKLQTALIASLNDVDPRILPDARFRMLRAALSNQPRDVRTTALEVLAESKDPAARELLRQASTSDPDHEVKEVAAALYKANNQ